MCVGVLLSKHEQIVVWLPSLSHRPLYFDLHLVLKKFPTLCSKELGVSSLPIPSNPSSLYSFFTKRCEKNVFPAGLLNLEHGVLNERVEIEANK